MSSPILPASQPGAGPGQPEGGGLEVGGAGQLRPPSRGLVPPAQVLTSLLLAVTPGGQRGQQPGYTNIEPLFM